MTPRIPAVALIIACTIKASAQVSEERDHQVETVMDDLLSQQDLDLNYDEVYESLLHRLTSPININKATAEELRSLLVLNENQVRDLLEHRARNGELLCVEELQSIPTYNPELIRRLRPLITVELNASPRRLLRRIVSERNNYLITRYERTLEPRAGFSNGYDSLHRFRGSPDKWYLRFRVGHPGDFSIGFTIEKDPGERSLTDFHSFHAQVMNQRRLSNLIIGDFQAQFGQGLTLGGGFGMGKGAETITSVRRNSLGFIPYSSVRETGYFRGLATTVSISRRVFIHAFASALKPDAKVESAHDGDHIASIQQTGYHRSVSELSSRNAVKENTSGLVLEYRRRAVQGGATFVNTVWNVPIRPDPDAYNQFDFAGRQVSNAGAFLNCSIANFTFFSEAAHTVGRGYGVVAGVLGSISKTFDISLVARKYDKDYIGIHANALSENSSPQNESGIYWGWRHQPSRSITLAGYADLFTFPWMRYRSYTTSSTGHEYLARVLWKPSKTTAFFIQAKGETKARNFALQTSGYKTGDATRRNYCVNADYALGVIGFKTRVQFSTLDFGGRTGGIAVVQDLRIDWRNWGLYARYALFDTDDFDNRQYVYEPDMWLAYSFPAYYGTGIRSMAMVRCKISRQFDVWLRWARTLGLNQESTGTGVDQIEGPARNDLKAQLRVRL